MKNIYIFLCILFVSLLAKAEKINVCRSCKITTLNKAIAQANSHDTIILQQGTYLEHGLRIGKPITILGDRAIFDAQFKGGVLEINADSVHVSGITFNNIKTSYTKDIAAITTNNIQHFIFENLKFNHPFFAILIQKSKDGIIRNNTINGNAKTEAGSGNGIHLWHCKNIRIENNSISKMRDGIYLEFAKNCITKKNISKQNIRYGLHFMFSNHNSYSNNRFIENGAGVAVMFSKYIDMTDNLFQYNWGSSSYGLLLKEIYDAEITNNIFQKNTIGINAEGSTRVNYHNNIFNDNGWAVRIMGGCFDNTFSKNDFIGNTLNISYQGNKNGNTFNGNYWSDYSGYDLNRDGIGDVPHRPVKLFSYIVNKTPETIILLRSFFIDLVNFSEQVSPIFTPKELQDDTPALKKINS